MILNTIIFLSLLLLASAAYAGYRGAPWVPTWKRDLSRISRLACVKPGERFVELGCGNARVCRFVAKGEPRAEVVGVELSIIQFVVGWIQNRLAGSGVKMRLQNAFVHDLSSYDIVYVFLMPETYEKIRPKLEAELKAGSRVISYVWPIPGWKETQVDKQEGSPTFYLYVV